jgi:NAD(P)-dependent dehydrogenase (short-subunit alcohol dehydrogenase family)
LSSELNFDGKAVLVTGAASGLGRATATRLRQLGAELFLVDVNGETLEGVAADLGGGGGGVSTLALDLSDKANCAQAVDQAVARMGRLNALCNVAGVVATDHFTNFTPERFDRVMAVNFAAPYFLSQRAIPYLLETSGAIVNVCSSSAYIGHAYMSVYAASKAALVSLTKSLALEYARTPLRVCAVAPAGMRTNLLADIAFPSDADYSLVERFSGLRDMTPVEEVADMIAWMASDRGGPFHGVCVQMDAGTTAG